MVSCALCGKTIEESHKIIYEIIEGKRHIFDNQDCVLMFKKLESVFMEKNIF